MKLILIIGVYVMKRILRYLFNSLMIILVISCGGGGGGTVLTTITSFEASPTTIKEGESVNLTAVFQNGSASINNNVGAVSSNVAKSVTPTTTTTYTLKVTNSLGAFITSSVTVTVLPGFNIFPPGFFGGSYSNNTVSFTGSDTDLNAHTATLLEESGDDATVNLLSVKTIEETLLITNVGGGGSTNGGLLSKQYWTTDLNDLKYVGYEVPGDSSFAIAISNSVMPIVAFIDDSGTMGSYERSDGSTFTITWQLVADNGENAKYTTTTVSDDGVNGPLTYTAKVSSVINQAGIISSQEVVVVYHSDFDRTLTLTSP